MKMFVACYAHHAFLVIADTLEAASKQAALEMDGEAPTTVREITIKTPMVLGMELHSIGDGPEHLLLSNSTGPELTSELMGVFAGAGVLLPVCACDEALSEDDALFEGEDEPLDSEPSCLTVEFANDEAREHFASWLCGAGEQHYWDWMRIQEGKTKGPITATEFNYHGPEDITVAPDDPERFGDFLCDNIIRTTCGRLSRDDG